ncbi:hypothetical protein FQN50_006228 [Emmonsiellopsis sp. PD_5]|nr:hypothetical protein FQN50_006228 [Emmonsiellopsis sp. PD_5]
MEVNSTLKHQTSAPATTIMEPIKSYEPFLHPREFSDLMPELFDQYWSYPSDLFFFSWLQKTSDLKVVCKETTEENVDFPTLPALENAIQNCARINSPGVNDVSSPADYGWTGWMGVTIDDLKKEASITPGEQ